MLVISDTSPLLYLYQTGHIDLLREIYGQICLPQAVRSELRMGAEKGFAVPSPSDYPWFKVIQVTNPRMIPLVTDLGPGEAEAIALAIENPGSLLILDDQLGRRIARANGLRVTGTLGVVLKAKRAGLLPSVAAVVAELMAAGLWIDDALASMVIAEAGERPVV